jgi:hypothetical protein
MPDAKFLAGFWMLGEDRAKVEEWREAVGADFAAASLADTTALVLAEALSAQRQAQRRDATPARRVKTVSSRILPGDVS